MGILGNEAADVLAKNAAERVPPDDHDRWMSGGTVGKAAEEGLFGGRRAMGWRLKAASNYCRLRGGKGIGRWWEMLGGYLDYPNIIEG